MAALVSPLTLLYPKKYPTGFPATQIICVSSHLLWMIRSNLRHPQYGSSLVNTRPPALRAVERLLWTAIVKIAGGMLSSLEALQQFTMETADIMNSCDEESKTWFSRFSSVPEDFSEPLQLASSSHQHLQANPFLHSPPSSSNQLPLPPSVPEAPHPGGFSPGIKVYSSRPRPPSPINDNSSSALTASLSDPHPHLRQSPHLDANLDQIQVDISSITLSPELTSTLPNEDFYEVLPQFPDLTPPHNPWLLANDGDVDMPGVDMPLRDDDPDDDGDAAMPDVDMPLQDNAPDDDVDAAMPGITSQNTGLSSSRSPPGSESPPQSRPQSPPSVLDSSQYKLRRRHPKEDADLPPPQASFSSPSIKRKKQNKEDSGRGNAREQTKPLSLTCTYECYDQYNLAVRFLPSISDDLLIYLFNTSAIL